MATEDDRFDRWMEALEARHLADLTFAEVSRALRALSSAYVERRRRLTTGAALAGAGKRAAFALFYGPLHYLLVREILRALPGTSQSMPRFADLGCGTGAAGAAWGSVARSSTPDIARPEPFDSSLVLTARGESLAAFDGRRILAGGVAPPSNIPDILGRPHPTALGNARRGPRCRALPARRLARLGATPDFHHGLRSPSKDERLAQDVPVEGRALAARGSTLRQAQGRPEQRRRTTSPARARHATDDRGTVGISGRSPEGLGIDRHPWALAEAARTYSAFGLRARTWQGDAARAPLPKSPCAILAAFTVNELADEGRARLLTRLIDRAAHGDSVLLIEPIARPVTPWWDRWVAAFAAVGGRADEWRIRVELPPLVARLDRAAGLNHRELTARSLWIPARQP